MEEYSLKNAIAYLHPEDYKRVLTAFELASRAHAQQMRLSGEPYIIHPVEVATIVAELRLDADSICAALLHDVVEDTEYSETDIKQAVGEPVSNIVQGLTKLAKVHFHGVAERQAENYRRFFIATARDPRVLVIKLADRLHNMRTLASQPPEKQQDIARETLRIYAPLAGRCGIQRLKAELEDLSLKYLHPEDYEYLEREVEQNRVEFQAALDEYVAVFRKRLLEEGIRCNIYGRIKHLYSIYRKMSGRRIPLTEVFDLLALRIITQDENEAYLALGITHGIGTMIPARFRDFISMPKSNGYQSLHTTIVINGHENLEVQIRTEAMHEMAEKGVATHWAYKEGGAASESSRRMAVLMRELLELGQDSEDAVAYLEELEEGLLDDEIRVFTPRFDVITLPMDSTPVDFAYRVHTEVGHRCISARVNGRIATLDSPLENGDIVEIQTTKNPRGPSMNWLKFVKTRTARERIRSWFRLEKREENIALGESALIQEIRKMGHDISQVSTQRELDILLKRHNRMTWNDLLAAIGFGEISAHTVAHQLVEAYIKTLPQELPSEEELLAEVIKPSTGKNSSGIIIDQIDNLVYRLAKCCNPIPGEKIIGYVTRGHGITVHRENCPALRKLEPERLLQSTWGTDLLHNFTAPLFITALDRPNVLQQVLLHCQEARVTILAVNARSRKNNLCSVEMSVEVASVEQLEGLKNRIRNMRDVYTVEVVGSSIAQA